MKHLTKKQLIACLTQILDSHQAYYTLVENKDMDVNSAFYQFSGGIIGTRDNYNLPPLKKTK